MVTVSNLNVSLIGIKNTEKIWEGEVLKKFIGQVVWMTWGYIWGLDMIHFRMVIPFYFVYTLLDISVYLLEILWFLKSGKIGSVFTLYFFNIEINGTPFPLAYGRKNMNKVSKVHTNLNHTILNELKTYEGK